MPAAYELMYGLIYECHHSQIPFEQTIYSKNPEHLESYIADCARIKHSEVSIYTTNLDRRGKESYRKRRTGL